MDPLKNKVLDAMSYNSLFYEMHLEYSQTQILSFGSARLLACNCVLLIGSPKRFSN